MKCRRHSVISQAVSAHEMEMRVARNLQHAAIYRQDNQQIIDKAFDRPPELVRAVNAMRELIRSQAMPFSVEAGDRGRRIVKRDKNILNYLHQCLGFSHCAVLDHFGNSPYLFVSFREQKDISNVGEGIDKIGEGIDKIVAQKNKEYDEVEGLNHEEKYRISPYFTLLLRIAIGAKVTLFDLNETKADLINDLVTAIRKEAATKEFKRSLQNHERTLRDSIKRVRDLLEWLGNQHTRVVAARLDFEYATDYGLSSKLSVITLEIFKRDVALLMRCAERIPSKLNHLWQVQHGAMKSYSLRLVLFLDGNETADAAFIGEALGRCWTEMITNGRGRYTKCGGHRPLSHCHATIAETSSNEDVDSWSDLERFVLSWAESDRYCKLSISGVGKTLVAGQLKRTSGSST